MNLDIKKIIKELSVIFARLINHYKFNYQTKFSAKFDIQDEDNQVLDEIEFFNKLNIDHKLTETDTDNTDIKSPLQHQTHQQGMKDSGWRFEKGNSMTMFFLQNR